MQLLQIHITPMKYELEIEHARLEHQQDFTPEATIKTTPQEMRIKTEPTKLQLDTYEARRSLGFKNSKDMVNDAAQKGRDSLSQYIDRTARMGKQMAEIENGVTIGQIFRQKLTEMPNTTMAFLPSTGANVSWEPGQISFDFSPGSVDFDWEVNQNKMNYIPGSVRMKILQYAKVEIEYLGEPMYVPPSSSPTYDETSVG